MFRLLLAAFIIVPIAELYVFAQVGGALGFGTTFLLIVGISIVGAWLVKMEGIGVWLRAQQRIARGQAPTDELVNGLLILFAGALMLTPGFLTDAFGLTLLFPPTRSMYRGVVRSRLLRGPLLISGFGFGGRTSNPPGAEPTDGVWDVDGWEEPPERPSLS